jgi:sterol 3beta-glucosyltransferase
LFRGILVVGNIHLTTHRITFHAVLPPPKMSLSGDESNDILHSGAATIRRQNPIFSAKTTRVWMELDNEMITTYPSADEEGRVKPLRSILRE